MFLRIADDNLPIKLRDMLSSFGGVLGHYRSSAIRRDILDQMWNVGLLGDFDMQWKKFCICSIV